LVPDSGCPSERIIDLGVFNSIIGWYGSISLPFFFAGIIRASRFWRGALDQLYLLHGPIPLAPTRIHHKDIGSRVDYC